MKHSNTNKVPENAIYLILWILVFTIPVFLSNNGNGIDWVPVVHQSIRIFPFFLIFLVNNFVLFYFFRKNNIQKYLVFTAIAIILVSFLGSFNREIFELLHIPQPPRPPRAPLPPEIMFIYDILLNLVFSILVIGLNNAIKMAFGFLQDKKDYEQLQKENLENQLSLLQHQINPHFFMNTLNNIHALIDYDKEIAKNAVIKLSKLMRALLYENENYTLQKEINFIQDYIELMKIRVNQNVEIRFDYPENIPDVSFPPLLFISFIENSFKHGIMPVGKSFIHVLFSIENDFLHAEIINSKAFKIKYKTAHDSIGLNNSKKRMALIYDKNYNFDVKETDTTFEIKIKIPLHENKMPGY